MNISEIRVDTSTFDKYTSGIHRSYAERKNFVLDTKLKYNSYKIEGRSIFAVTLSTFLKSEKIAKSDKMRKFWVREFMHRLAEQLPHKLKGAIDFDFVIERSPDGHYHYHGLIAMPKEAGDRIWENDALNSHLVRDLNALRKKGEHRDFAVNAFLIEPMRPNQTIDAWIGYMTKTRDYIASSAW